LSCNPLSAPAFSRFTIAQRYWTRQVLHEPSWGDDVARIITALVPYLWVVLAAAILLPARQSIATLLARLGGLEIFGIKLAIVGGGRAMNAAISMAKKHRRYSVNVDIPEEDRRKALERAERDQHLLADAEILWVDDRPANNRNESRMLRSFGTVVTFAASTPEALEALQEAKEQGQPFHAILSDISRNYIMPAPDDGPPPTEAAPPGDAVRSAPVPTLINPAAGIDMLKDLAKQEVTLPVIFYVGHVEPGAPAPAGAFGITDRPDQLLQLILDALARTRG
jgi:CheY-like chemotaxis protein